MICHMAFIFKGQTKAAKAFKGHFGGYGPIFIPTLSAGSKLAIVNDLLHVLYN